MNAVRNSILLFYAFMLIVGLGLAYAAITPIMNETVKAISSAGLDNPTTTKVYLDYLNLKSMMITSFYVIISIMITMAWISSFVDKTSLFKYIINTVALLIITPLLIYIVATYWNEMSLVGISFDEIRLEFVTNWGLILTANLFAGLLSFLFTRRGE